MSSSIKSRLLPALVAALNGIALAQVPETKIVASDAASSDIFGLSVAIDGDYAIVGAYGDDDGGSSSGSAYIFKRDGTDWNQETKIVASDAASYDNFGKSVAIDGDYAVVGAHQKNDVDGQQHEGAAYVFHRGADGNWTQQQRLIAENTETITYLRFGVSVDIDGDYVVVGANNPWSGGSNNNFNGAAYVYIRNNTTWTQQQRLVHPDPGLTTGGGSSDYFGNSVSISGNYIIVGTPNDNEDANQAGAAYIFTRSNTSWSSPEQIVASDAAASDQFGNSVAIDGDYAIVGAYGDDDGGSSSGSAYIFKRDGTDWNQETKIVASDAASSDNFGNSVAIDGDYAIVGAYGDDDGGSSSGSAYIFKRDGTDWNQETKIVASDAASSDNFGNSVAIDGDYAIVGAYGDDDAGSNSGSAYVYEIGLPVIISTSMANDNSTVTVTFSEAVYSTDGGSGALDVSDFALSLSGGWATLTSATPTSISASGNAYTLGINLSGTPNGNEVLTVLPIANAIYNADGNAGSQYTSYSSSSISVNLNQKILTEVESLEHYSDGDAEYNHLVKVDDDTYALANMRGLTTFDIPADGSSITKVGSYEAGTWPSDIEVGGIVKVDDDTYAVSHSRQLSGGRYPSVSTFTISATGTIQMVETLAFDGQSNPAIGKQVSLVKGVDDTYVASYFGPGPEGGAEVVMRTLTIEADGTMTALAVIEASGISLTLSNQILLKVNNNIYAHMPSRGNQIYTYAIPPDGSSINELKQGHTGTGTSITGFSSFVKVDHDTYALANGATSTNRGDYIYTFTISKDGKTVTKVADFEFIDKDKRGSPRSSSSSSSEFPYISMVKLNSKTFVMAYSGDDFVGYLDQFEISADGASITRVGSMVHDTERNKFNSLVVADANTVVLAYTGEDNHGYIKTFTFDSQDDQAPVITITGITSDNTTVDVEFTEEVFNSNGGSGNLEVSDFSLSMTGGTATLGATTPTSITQIDENTWRLGLNISGASTASGEEVLTVTPASNAIYDVAGNAASASVSDSKKLTDKIAATITGVSLGDGNQMVTVTFSDSVFNGKSNIGVLELSDFTLSISGGTATSISATKIYESGKVTKFRTQVSGLADGTETVTISPASNAIFDRGGNPTTQSNNVVSLKADKITQIDSLNYSLSQPRYYRWAQADDDIYIMAVTDYTSGRIVTFDVSADGSSIQYVANKLWSEKVWAKDLVKVDEDTYAVAWKGYSYPNEGKIATLTISTDGATIDTVHEIEFESSGLSDEIRMVKVDDDTYAVAWVKSNIAHITTFTISADGETIEEVAELPFNSHAAYFSEMVKVDDNIIAMAYSAKLDGQNKIKGFVSAFNISDDGATIQEVGTLGHTDEVSYLSNAASGNTLVSVKGNKYALAYQLGNYNRIVKTFSISDNGQTIQEVKSLTFDEEGGFGIKYQFIKMSDRNFVLGYSGTHGATVSTFAISDDGSNITEAFREIHRHSSYSGLGGYGQNYLPAMIQRDSDTFISAGSHYPPYNTIKTFDFISGNLPPVITSAPTVTTSEDTEYAFAASDFNYFDSESAVLNHIEVTSLESAGTLYLDADDDDTYDSGEDVTVNQDITAANITTGHLRFAPAADSSGSGYTTFAYKVNDGENYSSAASTFTINVTAVNDAPTATAQTVTSDEDVDKTITLSGEDTEGSAITYTISRLPANGTLYQTADGSTRGDAISTVPTTVSDGSHRIIYRSAVDGNGDDHGNFGFKVNDGNSDSDEATVTVNVAPVDDDITATAQTVSANEDEDKTITLAATDIEGRTLSYKITTLPTSGTLYQTSDGSARGDAISSVPTTVTHSQFKVIYVSAANGSGDGHGNFGFKAFVGSANSPEATVTVNVAAVSDVPVATAQTVTVNEDTDVAITLAGNDVDGDNLSYKIATLPSGGTLYQATNDTTRGDTISEVPADVANAQFKMIYVSALNGNGDGYGNFGFTVNDGTTDSDTATVTVNVTAVNDAPVATAQTVTADEDLDKVITLSGTDIEGSALAYSITTLPSKGTLYQANSDTSRGNAISEVPTTVIHTDFKLVYVSALNGNGDGYGNFAFKVNDGTDDSDAAAVTVNVSPVDDPPTVANEIADVAVDEAADETQNKTYIDLSTVFTDLDDNDWDIIKSVHSNTNDSLLTASVTGDTLTLVYFLDKFGSTTLTVRGTSNSLWVEDEFNVLVTNVDYELTAAPQAITVDEDVDLTITLLGSDESGRDLIFQVTTLPLNGTLFQTDDGTTRGDAMTSFPTPVTSVNQQVIYASDPHQFGEDYGNFGFRITTDDGSKSREEEITVDVFPVNDPPLDITLTPNSVENGLDSLSYVGMLTTSDADTFDTHTYRFVSGEGDVDNNHFRIEGDALITVEEMNYPTQPIHSIRIRATDPFEVIYEEALSVFVIGEGMTVPHVTPDQAFTLSEYTAVGTELGYLEGTDIDEGDILQDWTIVSGDDEGHFTLDDSTGTLTTTAIVNFEDIPSYTLGITVSDSIFTSPVEDVIIQVTDVDEGIFVNRSKGLVTSEYEESDTFTVVLESAPLENVIIPVFSSDLTEANVFPDSLIFTPSDWSKPKTVTVKGKDDFAHDENVAYSIILASTVSLDPNYSGIDLPDVAVTNMAKDIQGPVVTFLPLDPGYGSINTPLTINAKITDINNIKNPVLIYAAGGNTKTGVIFMDSTGVDQFQATIPGDAMTFMGISYYISTSDNKNNTTTSDLHSAEVKFPKESLSSDIAGSVIKEGLPRNKWRMISVPARLDKNDVAAVLDYALGDKESTTWDIRQWNGEDWEESTELEPGKGYWLIHDVKAEFPFTTGSGYSLDQTEYNYDLQPGWNMIANPYPFPVNLNTGESNVYGPISYGWTGEGWSSPETLLLPWAGYGIYNRWVVNQPLVLTPVESPNKIARKNVTVPDGWKLNIGAYGKTYIDPGNAVGRLSGSLEGLDFRDNPEPPYMGGYVSVVMPRSEWNENISHFTSDIRSLVEPDGVWDLDLKVKEETSPVTLSLHMEGDFPVEHDIVLLDLINRETYNIKETSSVTVNQNWDKLPVYPFKVIAGSPEYVSSMTQEILSQLPETFTLHQNYPNPFNPTTTIRFEIPVPSQVSLKIYNLMGQEVRTLTRDWFPMGNHQLIWNGKDQRGIPVSAGVYIYRLQSQNFQKTRKMVLLK